MSFGIGAGPSGRRPPGFSQYADLPSSSATPPSSPFPPFQSPQRLLPSFGVVEAQEQAFPSPVNFGVASQLKRSRSTSPVNYAGASQSKRTRSPDENFSEKLTRASLGLDDWRGQIASPSLASIHPNFYNNAATAQTNQGEIALSLKHTSDVEIVPQGNIFDENTPKNVMTITQRRENLPAFLSSQLSTQSNKNLPVDDSEREALAKAKRLARFSKELSEPLKVFRKENLPVKRQGEITDETEKVSIESLKEDIVNGSPCDGKEGIKPSNVVVGLCSDMCPESEREERERKGDLDKYERLDGDRNQTSKHLAVKKYNRMAEREPILIRPMPVLKMTINYLFGLLDQPYSGNFLGLYNFMWDRLRAIRMDLRMQHLFDQEAITMLEQMIRLHVIAMHELCEKAKAEGFSDGFDAHLNIEQMNKTSSDLFQMYDDHIKKNLFVSTEREFRGYYALLKLDKHPGYKVEPAQLSLDLAKMSSSVRGSTEVLFARQVARACRTGNFVAFFRLAKNASYLQACLMHAHFAKLRSQALASLHSGLQNNQGIPVPQIVNWLAMEGEDIKSLFEFHGFAIRMYDVPYMVKEGQFLNSDMEFPNKCSHLVHSKKSERILDDVLRCNIQLIPTRHSDTLKVDSCNQIVAASIVDKSRINDGDVEMHYSEGIVCREEPKLLLAPDASSRPIVQHGKADTIAQVIPIRVLPAAISSPSGNRLVTDRYKDTILPESEKISFPTYNSLPESIKVLSSPIDEPLHSLRKPGKGMGMELSSPISQPKTYEKPPDASDIEWTAASKEVKTVEVVPVEENEISKAKLKLMIRIWCRRSKKQKEKREQRQMAAVAAFNRIPAGPPLFPHTPVRMEWVGELNFDRLKKERFQRQQKASARLNVSEVVGKMLSVSNPKSRCFCWKLVACSPSKGTYAGKWLHSKLLASPMKDDEELMLSSSDLAIWKKWFLNPEEYCYDCCLSMVRKFCLNDHNVVDLKAVVAGASSLLFVVSENLSSEMQKVQLHRLVQSLPLGSGIPLLILVCGLPKGMDCSYESITANLALHDVEKNRIKSFCIVPLLLYSQEGKSFVFVDDDPLRNGLEWLANESAQQPLLRQVQLRELVRRSLRFLMKKLDNLDHFSPNQCVDMFNEAVDRSVEELKTAAKNNYVVWPCPEVSLLEVGSVERSYADLYLPSIDWSSDSKIVQVVAKLVACKLPSFPDDFPSPNQGSVMAEDLKNQKVALQSKLIWYLTAATKLFPDDMAGREANIMLEKGCFLQLNGSKFTIMPRWAMIFRRINNWRLEELAGKGLEAYVLEDTGPSEEDLCSYSELFSNFDHEVDVSLDEMISVACVRSLPYNNGNKLISEADIRKYQETDAHETPEKNCHPDHRVSLNVKIRNDHANASRANDCTSDHRVFPNVDFRKDQEVDMHATPANDCNPYHRVSSNVNLSDVTLKTGISEDLQKLLDGGLFSGPEGEKLWMAMDGATRAQNRVTEMLSYYGY